MQINVVGKVQGLRLLGEQEKFRLLKKRLLQDDIQKGLDELDSGQGTPLDIDAIIQRCKAKKAKFRRG